MLQKDKKAVSEVIGYILLISLAVVMSVIVYAWLKSYVPKDVNECPEDVSVFIEKYSCENEFLNLTFRNNGKFNVTGYYIKGTNNSENQELAIHDLSKYFGQTINFGKGKKVNNVVYFKNPDTKDGENLFSPGDELTHVFEGMNEIDEGFIEVLPIRFQDYKNSPKLTSCTNAKIRQEIICQ